MNGVKFGNFHSYKDLHLILAGKTIGQAPVKEIKVNIEGGDSVLDYTEFFGEPKFDNRQLTFEFISILPQSQLLAQYSAIQDALHGKKLEIIVDDDPEYFYRGRISVSDWRKEKVTGKINISADCEPYKCNLVETVVSKTVSGSATITLSNSRKRVVPEITTDSEMTIAFGGYSVTASAGTFKIPMFELTEGINTVSVTGNGTIKLRYREGRL